MAQLDQGLCIAPRTTAGDFGIAVDYDLHARMKRSLPIKRSPVAFGQVDAAPRKPLLHQASGVVEMPRGISLASRERRTGAATSIRRCCRRSYESGGGAFEVPGTRVVCWRCTGDRVLPDLEGVGAA